MIYCYDLPSVEGCSCHNQELSSHTKIATQNQTTTREVITMSNNTSGTTNKVNVPEAKAAMEQFKYEVANEIGVPLKKGYNGDLTSAQNGYVGGYMVKKMIEQQEKMMADKSNS